MSQRLGALRSRLPDEVLARIMQFDSHPTADLIKQIDFCPVPPTKQTSAGMLLKVEDPVYFIPAVKELKRRLFHNRTRHLHGGAWLPVFFYHRTWRLSFDMWRYETMLELDYLPDWVDEEYKSGIGEEQS